MPSSSLRKPSRPLRAARALISVLHVRRSGPAAACSPLVPAVPPERLGASLGANTVLVFTLAMLAGLVLITVASIGAGLLVTRVIEHAWGIGAADERVTCWLAAHRTPGRTQASLIGSIVAGGVVLPIVAGVDRARRAVLRQWRIAAFVVFALAVESATYRITTLCRPLAPPARRSGSSTCPSTRATRPVTPPRRSRSTAGSRSCSRPGSTNGAAASSPGRSRLAIPRLVGAVADVPRHAPSPRRLGGARRRRRGARGARRRVPRCRARLASARPGGAEHEGRRRRPRR